MEAVSYRRRPVACRWRPLDGDLLSAPHQVVLHGRHEKCELLVAGRAFPRTVDLLARDIPAEDLGLVLTEGHADRLGLLGLVARADFGVVVPVLTGQRPTAVQILLGLRVCVAGGRLARRVELEGGIGRALFRDAAVQCADAVGGVLQGCRAVLVGRLLPATLPAPSIPSDEPPSPPPQAVISRAAATVSGAVVVLRARRVAGASLRCPSVVRGGVAIAHAVVFPPSGRCRVSG